MSWLRRWSRTRAAPALSHAPRPSEARAPSGMAPKVPVVVRVELGKKHHQSGRMHEAEVALSLVVSDALERAEPEIAAGKLTASTVKCFRTTEFSGTGTVPTTVGILRDMFGCNIKVLATAEDSPATPGMRPNAMTRLMQTQAETPRALPPAPDGDRYDCRLLRALLSNLQRDGLSFPVLDANASGQRILSAIAAGLQYVLPFDDSDPSPLVRLAGRVHLVVPRRFKTEALNNETPSEDHHGAKPLDSRLSAKKLRSYGEAIAGFIGCATAPPPPPSPLNCLLLLLALSQEPGACV